MSLRIAYLSEKKTRILSLHRPILSLLANQCAEALIILDQELKIVLVNKAAEIIFNQTQQELDLYSFRTLCFARGFGTLFIDAIDRNPANPNNEVLYTKHNQTKLGWTWETLTYENTTYHLLKTINYSETEAKNTIRRLETLIENMPCNVYWMDKNCLMMGCNQNCLDMLNMTLDQFVGKTYEEIAEFCNWPAGVSDKLKNDDLTVLRTGKPIFGVEDPPILNADKSVSNFLTSRVPLRNSQGEIIGVAGISTEISALKRAREQAEAANDAKTVFIANMSHDIRTPLSGIVGLTQMVMDAETNAEKKQHIQWIHDSGEQLLHLLNDILEMVSSDNVRETDLHESSFDIRECIEGIVQLAKPSTQLKGLALKVDVDASIPDFVITDRTKLHRILLNLLGNAIKFTEKGHITIAVSLLNITTDHLNLRFEIIDSGIGIPDDAQDKVFDRFYKNNPSYEGVYTGNGLGLHIVQSYVALLGSDMQLISKEGVGTTFYFDLHLKIGKKRDHAPSIDTLLQPTYALASAEKEDLPAKLLLVEDNHIARRVVESIAKETGWDFISVADGEEALQAFKKQPFDVVITDIGLPGISGIELATQIRAFELENKQRPAPIIGLSAHAQGQIREECLEAGMNDVFTKPVNVALMKAIKNTFVKQAHATAVHDPNPVPYTNTSQFKQAIPKDEQALFQLESFLVLDFNQALQRLKDDKTLLKTLLVSLISDDIPKYKTAMHKAYQQEDFGAIEEIAHNLKGGSLYCGTVKLQYACLYFERYYRAGHTVLLKELYLQLVQVLDETYAAIQLSIRAKRLG